MLFYRFIAWQIFPPVVDEATIVSFVILQDITPLERRKIYFKVDFLVSSHPEKSEYE